MIAVSDHTQQILKNQLAIMEALARTPSIVGQPLTHPIFETKLMLGLVDADGNPTGDGK